MTTIRIGNISSRITHTIKDNKPYIEIVKWETNTYYGKEKHYIYDKKRNVYKKRGAKNQTLNSNVFKNKEHCFTLAVFRDGDLSFIGRRPFELNTIEFKRFYTIADMISTQFES